VPGRPPRHSTRQASLSLRTDHDKLIALVREAVDEGREVPPVGVPDGFNYEITVDGKAVYCADPRLTDAQSTVITRVLKEGREES
jgi:hypothetical protein